MSKTVGLNNSIFSVKTKGFNLALYSGKVHCFLCNYPDLLIYRWDIFQWRLSGLSYQNIARKLNERGIPSPSRYHYLKGDATSERYANTLWTIYSIINLATK